MPGNELGLSMDQLIAALGDNPVANAGAAIGKGILDWAKYPGQVYAGTAPENVPQTDWAASTAMLMAGAPRPVVRGPVLYSGAGMAMPKVPQVPGYKFGSLEEELKALMDSLGQQPTKASPKLNPFEQAAATGDNSAIFAAQESAKANEQQALDHYQRAREAKTNIPAMPFEEPSRQAARIAAGFDTPAYHGSRDWNGRKLSTNSEGKANFYTSAQPELADMYAGVYPHNKPQDWAGDYGMGYDKASVQPVYLNTRDFHVHDAKGQDWAAHTANNQGINDALNKGAPGVTIKNVYDEPASTKYLGAPKDIHIVFDPTKVRSAFAQFDPQKLHLNDLLAGLGGAGVVGGGVLASNPAKAVPLGLTGDIQDEAVSRKFGSTPGDAADENIINPGLPLDKNSIKPENLVPRQLEDIKYQQFIQDLMKGLAL